MDYTLKPLTSHYKRSASRIFKETWPEIPESDFEISWQYRSYDHSSAILNTTGEFIGFIIASLDPKTKMNLYIDYIALAAESRGSGIGSRILKNIVSDTFHRNGSVHLYPECPSRIPWYVRNGFYPTHGGYYNFHSYSTRKQVSAHTSLKRAV